MYRYPPSPSSVISLVLCFAVAGCASDFDPDRAPTRATRAVQDPLESNSANAEARQGGTADAVPLVTVGIPNHDGQTPQVRTVADNIHDTLNPPAASSTPTTPTTTAPNTHIDPVHGMGE